MRWYQAVKLKVNEDDSSVVMEKEEPGDQRESCS